MVYVGTFLKNIDNSGARIVRCIGVLSKFKQRRAALGELITVSVQKLRAKRRQSSKVRKGQVLKALIVRAKKGCCFKGARQNFFESAVILLNKQKKLAGSRIFGALPKAFRYSKHLRLVFLATGVVN